MSHMARSILFRCNKTHKGPTLKGGCIKPYVVIWKIAIIAKHLPFHRETDPPRTLFFIGKNTILAKSICFHWENGPPRTLFFHRDGWGSGCCYKTHKDPNHKGGCIRSYAFIWAITNITNYLIFHRDNDPPRTLFFHRDGWGSG